MKNLTRWMVFAALVGCVEQPTAQTNRNNNGGANQQELERIRRQVVSRQAPSPAPQHALNFNYNGKVELLGYTINTTGDALRPGQSVTVTWFWHCLTPTGDGWRLFTHLDDINGPRTNEDNVGDTRRAYQPERWRAGEYVRDVQTFELPQDWDSPTVKIHVGLWKDAERMPVTPTERTDGSRRALAMTLSTGIQIQLTEAPLRRAAGAINPDGRLDETAWAGAPVLQLVNPLTGNAAGQTDAHATARMLWDDQNLYVAFEVNDDNLIDPSGQHDDHLWEHDAVEVMIDPNGDAQNYFELQVSPKNQHFETRYDRARDPQPSGHMDWNPNVRSGVVTTGTIGNAEDTDTGYVVEMAIPWSDINQGLAHMPPQAGDNLRLNLFVMDEPKTGGQRAAAWSAPRRGDFHTLERFGQVTVIADAPVPALPAVPTQGGPAPTALNLNAIQQAAQGVAPRPRGSDPVAPNH